MSENEMTLIESSMINPLFFLKTNPTCNKIYLFSICRIQKQNISSDLIILESTLLQ